VVSSIQAKSTASGRPAGLIAERGPPIISPHCQSTNPATTTVVPNGWYWGGVSDPTQWYDSATTANRRIRMQVTGTQSYAENQLAAWQGDVERTFENSVLSGIRVGVRYEHNKFISQGYRTSAYGIQTQNIDGNFESTSPSVNGFFGGTAPGYSTNWQATNIDYALSKLLPVTVYPGGALGEEVEILRLRALLADGDARGAREAGESFLGRHPASPLAARVRSLLDDLGRSRRAPSTPLPPQTHGESL